MNPVIRSLHPLAWLFLLAALAACPAKRDDDGRSQTPNPQAAVSEGPRASSPESASERDESAHHVVFADRTSQAYVLLLTSEGPAPTRESLSELVRTKLVAAEDEPEVKLLLELIATEPRPSQSDPSLTVEERQAIRHQDLLGLYIDLLPVAPQLECFVRLCHFHCKHYYLRHSRSCFE